MTNDKSDTLNMTTEENRERARLLYAQGLSVTQISKTLNEKYPTVASWKKRDAWVRASIFENVTSAMQARLLALIGMEKKGNSEYKEIDEFTRQLERLAKIQRYNDGGNGATLNPKLSNRCKEDRKGVVKNLFTEADIDALEEAFNLILYPFQKRWIEILDGNKKHRAARIFMILKSRQIGATYVIALWALINALRTKKNKIFLSASKRQAHNFIRYIKSFVFQVLGRQIGGEPIVLSLEDNSQVSLEWMGTNALTAQGSNGDVIMDEFFWIHRFEEFRSVASGMASQSHYQQIYLSTPSSVLHEAYAYWSGKNGVNNKDIDISHSALKSGRYCADGKWRIIVNVKDAIRGGFDKLDIAQLMLEYIPERFANLYMCVFLDDSSSYFPLSVLQPNMVDSWQIWNDFTPMGSKKFAKPVWVGYDPSFTGDRPALAVIAPPEKEGQPYRVLERMHLDHMPPHVQAQHIKKVRDRYDVEFLGIDTTGAGISVAEHVKKFYPNYTAINYSVESKTRMALRAKELFTRRKLHFDAGSIDIAKAFIAIKQALTGSQRQMTFVSSRSKEVGHSDVAWAIMNALEKAPLASTDQINDGVTKSRIRVHT